MSSGTFLSIVGTSSEVWAEDRPSQLQKARSTRGEEALYRPMCQTGPNYRRFCSAVAAAGPRSRGSAQSRRNALVSLLPTTPARGFFENGDQYWRLTSRQVPLACKSPGRRDARGVLAGPNVKLVPIFVLFVPRAVGTTLRRPSRHRTAAQHRVPIRKSRGWGAPGVIWSWHQPGACVHGQNTTRKEADHHDRERRKAAQRARDRAGRRR